MSAVLRTAIGLTLFALTGCGGETQLSPVHGRVLYRGRPLQGGTIVFTPDAERGNAGPLAMAEIGPDGNYVLTTGGKPGAVPGWHRVTVAYRSGTLSSGSPSFSNLPRHYSHAEDSGQRHEVKAGAGNTIDIPLE
jgi:hypothetical protein